jgi:hypothetical protein
MAELVSRPTFYEGQILAPEDLNGTLDYSRVGLARHERYLHTAGIATGLDLQPESRATPGGVPFVAVSVQPGMAIDPTGRQIVVPDAQPLNEGLFELLNGAREQERIDDPDLKYPVFLVGLDEELPPTGSLGGVCDLTASSRVSEAFELTFGVAGEEQQLADEVPPEIGEGPGGAPGERRSKILLGFVQWDDAIDRFVAVSPTANGVGPAYAGVAADVVQARGGELILRSRPPTESGKPAVVVTDEAGGELRFGLQDAGGRVSDPVFRVTSAGDVVVQGKVGSVVPAGVHVESGIATDGTLLPLPKGIKPEQVERGQAIVHTHVTPRFDELGGPFTGGNLVLPLVCTADDRRVHCRFFDLNSFSSVPGRCDYTVLVVVSEEGATP